MSIGDWQQEISLLRRYAGSGAVNTVFGFICIFFAMEMGLSPMNSNIVGFGVGFCLSFLFSRKFVFRSKEKFAAQGVRYIISFAFCFLCNLMMLKLALYLSVHAVVSQFVASGTYSILMYLLARLFIFDKIIRRS